tara:strand:+ start:10693 stop:10917 length:225 start_codon:yes stop_codon:yes gene_type:complete
MKNRLKEKLKEMKLWNEFKFEFKKYHRKNNITIKDWLKESNSNIISAFSFRETTAGLTFWKNVSKEINKKDNEI